jgi:amidohydrolase
MKQKILQKSEQIFIDVLSYRQWFHQHPETAFDEKHTSDYISSVLTRNQISHSRGIAKTGIVGMIEGKNPKSKTIALRADMDALEIFEDNRVPYKSLIDGKMHACGHDAHMASLLGTLIILQSVREEFEGTVKFLFQPSEEKFPGGASVMIEEGVLENPRPDGIFGQHVFPELDAGKVGFKAGKYMASTDEIYLTVKGKGGHGGIPHQAIDAVLIAANIIVSLQQLVSRKANPTIPTVLSFGRVIADGRTNILPNEVHIDGTLRTFDEAWRKTMHQEIEKMARGIAQSMGGDCETRISHGYPFVYNNEALTNRALGYAIELLGKDHVVELDIRMTAEDFSYYGQIIPGCFYRLGIRNEVKNIISNLHSSTFDIDESSLRTGMALMAWLAIKELGN